jgi:hypothetical protein
MEQEPVVNVCDLSIVAPRGDPGMASAEDYRRYAAGCILMAEDSADSSHRLTLMETAQIWLRLAEQAEKNSRTNLVH